MVREAVPRLSLASATRNSSQVPSLAPEGSASRVWNCPNRDARKGQGSCFQVGFACFCSPPARCLGKVLSVELVTEMMARRCCNKVLSVEMNYKAWSHEFGSDESDCAL